MSIERILITPNITFTETDLTTNNVPNIGRTSLGIVGEFQKGRAFDPINVNNYQTFRTLFGGLNPCKFEGTQQPKYESAYIAKSFLNESNDLYAVRVLGLSGYDAGDSWHLTLGAGLDEESIEEVGASGYTMEVQYINGQLNSVAFSDPVMQSFYNEGLIDNRSWGTLPFATGDTFETTDVFRTNCETFEGLRFSGVVTQVDEPFICITGDTITGQTQQQAQIVQNCQVLFDENTVTTNSTLFVEIVNSIVIINDLTNELTVLTSGVVTFIGGTITHTSSTDLRITNGTIILPNGNTLVGGTYSVCDIAGNNANYDCDTVNGSGFTIVTGQTTITVPVTTTGTTTVTTQIPSGIVNIQASGEVVFSSGTPIESLDNTVFLTLRSNAKYDGSENLDFLVAGDLLYIEPLNGIGSTIRPYDDFVLGGTMQNGQTFEYIVSMDRRKPNYIAKVLGNFQLCCKNNNPIFIEESYQTMYDNMVADGRISCIKPTVCFNNNLNNFKTEYKNAHTPWIVSELRGNSIKRLFRLHTLSDGNVANKEVKVSIENIRPDARTFDISVRAFDDTDRRQTVLERFSRLSLNPDSVNYIGRRIGTVDGEYATVSKYILAEIGIECDAVAFPAGFEGYPVRDYDCGKAPMCQFRLTHNDDERLRYSYLGFSTDFGYDNSFFDFKGFTNTVPFQDWTGRTTGFHMDVDASSAILETETGNSRILEFEVGGASFKGEADTIDGVYEQLSARKFTVMFYGGFDGWDIYRTNRTNTDAYRVNGASGQLGFQSGNFDAYADKNIRTGLTSDYYAYLKGINQLRNRKKMPVDLVATPAINSSDHTNLIESTIEIIEDNRCDTFYVFTTLDTDDSGRTLLPIDVTSLLDNQFDTTYAATYFPWCQYNDDENNQFVYIPPTAEVMRAFAVTDKVAQPWFATSGLNRGRTNFIKPRVILDEEDTDELYDNRVNPLVIQRTQAGLTNRPFIWGQKTMQINGGLETALSRINVRRLMIFLLKELERAALPIIFEPNDSEVRRQFENAANTVMENARRERGIADYRVLVSDDVEDLNSNSMRVKIALQPIRTLEYIYVNFILTNQGVAFEDVL